MNAQVPGCVVAVATATLLLAGCISPARRLDAGSVAKLQEHSSKRGDVEQMFGKPRTLIVCSNGASIARYSFTAPIFSTEASFHERAAHPGDLLVRSLTLRYDRAGVVDKVLFSESVTPVVRDRNYVTAGQFLSRAELSRIHKAETTSGEVKELFGAPTAMTFDADGNVVMRWLYSVRHADYRLDKDRRELVVVIGPGDKVQDFFFYDNPTTAEHAAPETLSRVPPPQGW